jgi:HEPN domain-containing protein
MVTEIRERIEPLVIRGDGLSLSIEALPTSANGWPLRPFQIVSLPDMKDAKYRDLCGMLTVLSYWTTPPYADRAVDEDDHATLNAASRAATQMGLSKSALLASRIIAEFPLNSRTKAELAERIKVLEERIKDDLDDLRFMYIPSTLVSYYDEEPLFGEQVANKFGKTITDIQEAGKCLAVGRYTACVFHLMRVMEFAVQYLGGRLGISLVTQKNWANILDEVDKAIRALPIKTTKQRTLRNKFAESSAHLRMVKDAWRNDVMHPKETYTDDEAERIFRNVKDFMIHLATKL